MKKPVTAIFKVTTLILIEGIEVSSITNRTLQLIADILEFLFQW